MRAFIQYFYILLIVSASNVSQAGGIELLTTLKAGHDYQKFYRIKKNQEKVISLVHWEYGEDIDSVPSQSYQRTLHFKGWVRDPSHQSCFDVRNLVLQRQAEEPLVMHSKNRCMIYQSKWFDFYSGRYFYYASDLDIDHIVPLKNAYYSGAWRWSKAKRCHYSNFMADRHHLMVVQNSENRSKGGQGPDRYIPANSQFQCQYLSAWLKVKAVWNLRIALTEAEAIYHFLSSYSCPKEDFLIPIEEFTLLQNQIREPPRECLN